jgi:hypothetical protein
MDYRLESLVSPLSERMEEIAQQFRNLGLEKVEISVV